MEKTDTADKAARGVDITGSVLIGCSMLLTIIYELSAGILPAIPGLLGWMFLGFLHKWLVKKKRRKLIR